MQNPQVQQNTATVHITEEILVVPRSALFISSNAWQGISQSMTQHVLSVIDQQATYMPRAHAETNPTYKQIIPYILFTHDNKLFVMQRKSTASEQRLASKFSLGIGGHIRQEDIIDNKILSWAQREFDEEVSFSGNIKTTEIGILNDDSSDVGMVHLGFILLMHADNGNITIKDEHKSGVMLTLDECKALYPNMENWSKICLDFILQNPNILSL